jgi:Ser/Thr protein kinase RdoA (MazF antagonist)
MMKLSMMKKVVDTVNSEWRSLLAEEILERWGYDEGSVYYFRASANFLFIFKKNGATYFLRFNAISEKSLTALKAEIEILEYLRHQPLRVALPVQSLNQNFIETVENEWGTFYAVVFEALPGKQFETEELQKDQFFTWGSALGKLHHFLKEMPEEYRQNRKSWRDQLAFVQEILPTHETAALYELEQILKWSNGLDVTKENFGLIHYDFELDNQRWDNGMVGILDFDDCVNHWYAADIVFALRDLFEKEIDLKNELVEEFLSGYQSETRLDSQLEQEFPWFMRMHNLVSYTKLLRTVDIPESGDYPEWLSNLRAKLLRYMNQYRTSFERLAK